MGSRRRQRRCRQCGRAAQEASVSLRACTCAPVALLARPQPLLAARGAQLAAAGGPAARGRPPWLPPLAATLVCRACSAIGKHAGAQKAAQGRRGLPSGPPGACGAPAHPISPCPVVRWSIDARGPALAPRALVQQVCVGGEPHFGVCAVLQGEIVAPNAGIAAGRPAPPMHAAALAASAGRRLTPPPTRLSPSEQRLNGHLQPMTAPAAHTASRNAMLRLPPGSV